MNHLSLSKAALYASTLLFLSACNDNEQELPTEPTVIEAQQDTITDSSAAKPTLLERTTAAASKAKGTVEDSSWDNVTKSSKEIWNKSKKTSQEALNLSIESGKDAWQKSKETSLEAWEGSKEKTQSLWQDGKETSEDLWENGKTSSESLWNESKEKSQQLWDENSQKLNDLFNDTEEEDAFDKANQAFEADEI
ncbi:hypothetical protein OW492_04090 [Psychromonas sp. 14N.309.X.WAT.B.A12]|uniref:hypothetical protein n=1 Tax=Psychromonas sp. 14N.309.X.WAT.B.A12 TaxID=2998322 RepID=UPI0025B24FEF|nr:hypothetical protein [Psychromonas sp. 14N.309.X.WAT.B.A12]MDN2662558.1 hypothetical protein [Psychromonas sp. 14N.309.X.WAT.B.A12]